MGLSDFMAQSEAQSNIVTFGRDRQVANPLTIEITENGEYNVSLYTKAVVDVPGTVNTKEVLTGTANKLEIPAETLAELQSNDANAFIEIDMSSLPLGISSISGPVYFPGSYYTLTYLGTSDGTLANAQGYDVRWSTTDGSVGSAYALMGGNLTDMSTYMSMFPYQLTIYHHPMPEEP